MKKNNDLETARLRQTAEKLMKKEPTKISSQLSKVEVVLIHELEVHQIELEMQNEELIRTIVSSQDALDLYDFAPVGYFVLSDDSTIIKLNLSGADLLGKVRSDLIDCRFGFFVSDDTRSIFNQFLSEVFAGRTKISCELTFNIHDALPIYVRLNGISTNDKDRCLVNVIDITENKMIASGLEKTRKELEVIKIAADEISEFAENLINTVREPLLALDKDLRVVKASRSFYDFFKVTPDVTIGKLVYELGNNQWDIPKLRELLETILPEMTTFDDYEVEHNFSTIGKRNMLLNARQIEREMGKDKIILLAIEDITERTLIAAGLEKTRKELEVIKIAAAEISEFSENLINTVREPLLALDKDLRVVKASRSFYDFFKVTPDVTIGKLVYELGNNQWDIPKLRELLETILPEMTTFDDYEVEHVFSTIGKRNMLLNARQIERELGKDKIILLAIEDITERRQAEELIRFKNDELHKVNAEKDKFFSIIGHDLRSPFNSFLGLTQIMAEELPTLSINEIQKIATNMQISATNLYRLLGNLLDWSLIQQGLFPFDPTLVKLLPIVIESIELTVETAKDKNIEILVSVPEDLTVFADNNTLLTVIRNLVSNAVKFTPKGGKIMISAKITEDKSVEISIKDTGIGMDKNILDNLFRLDVNTCRKGTEGEFSTGLGLLLCKDFIEKHGGKLCIESQEGMGSMFYFTVPMGD